MQMLLLILSFVASALIAAGVYIAGRNIRGTSTACAACAAQTLLAKLCLSLHLDQIKLCVRVTVVQAALAPASVTIL